jgi:hypothetical protein
LARLLSRLPRAPKPASLSQRAERRRVSQRLSRWYRSEELPELLRALDPALQDVPVLVLGERGTGRAELVRYLHHFGGTQRGALLELRCLANTRSADIEKRLAAAQRDPNSAAGLGVGLRDVERLPEDSQEALCSWIETATVPGAPRIPFVRWIATTRESFPETLLPQLSERLAALSIRLPALRERPERIESIAARCADSWARAHRRPPRPLHADALEALNAYPWPGNVLELERVIVHSLIGSSGDSLRAADLQLAGRPLSPRTPAAAVEAPRTPHEPKPQRAAQVPPPTPHRSRFAELAVALARELRDPLATLRTLLSLDPEEFRDERFRERFTELAGDDLTRLDGLIEAVEALAAQPPRVLEALDLARLLDEMLAARAARIRDQQLLVVKEIDGELPPLSWDRARLRAGLEALLDQAFMRAARGGDLYLAARFHPERDGAGSIRLLMRFKHPAGHATPEVDGISVRGELQLALAALLLETQGARLALGRTEGEERVIVLDLPMA